MDFTFTEDQLAVRKLFHEFAEKEIRPGAAELDESPRYPIELFRKAGELGFFGMVVFAPFLLTSLEPFGVIRGLNLFNASIMLAFMAVPTITSISEDAIYSVPRELKEASLALGATHWETILRVILPASLPGISTAVILGMSRSIGETMVVLMVAGGAAQIPDSLFDSVRPMPASIAAEMGEAPFRGDHYHALFGTGCVLFIFTLAFNLVADYIAQKHTQVGAATL